MLDAAERIAAAPADAAVTIVVPSGAPFARNAVFFEVARHTAGPRRLTIVTSEARARSLAASAHVPAYASLTSLEREELDATERLGAQQRAALASVAARGQVRPLASPGRALAIGASLLAAALVLLAVTLPSAAVTVTANRTEMPPATFVLRAGPGGDIAATPLMATLNAKVGGTAGGSRTEETKAAGIVRFSNQTTNDVKIVKGTVVQTGDGIKFQTTEEKTLPSSVILGLIVFPGQQDIAVEAVVPGPGGNLEANKITVSNNRSFAVSNPQRTSGGDSKKIPVVRAEDYSAATAKAKVDAALAAEAAKQQQAWQAQAGTARAVYVTAPSLSSQGGQQDFVGKEVATFDVPVTGALQGFSVTSDQPGKAALERFRSMAGQGYVLDEGTAKFDVPAAKVDDRGVTWSVTANGRQYPQPDLSRIRSALAGRSVSEARSVLEDEGLHVVDLRLSPDWWPRMPLLDARIAVN
ncbi:MAG TPA: baseplate J/gp47 family protein [Candidatus Limnocylindria bacterium]